MTANARAFFLLPPQLAEFGGGVGSALWPEAAPAVLWGQGTPDGDRAPFTIVNKGSLYLQVNATDDSGVLWNKIDEGGDDADWELTGGEAGSVITIVSSTLIDISGSDAEFLVWHAVKAAEILEIGLLWEEATGASGAAEGDMQVGTAAGGGQIVATVAFSASQASGAYEALTIAEGTLAAGNSVFCNYDQAASADGTARLVLKIRLGG